MSPTFHSQISAKDLISSSTCVDDTLPIREVWTWFRHHPQSTSMAIAKTGGGFGLVTPSYVNMHLVDRLRDPNWQNQPITQCMIQNPAIVPHDMSIAQVVTILLKEQEVASMNFQDVIVTEKGSFLGLISPRAVILDHLESLLQRLTATEIQQASLARKNKELFDNSFRLGQTETQFRGIFERAPMPMVVFDADGKFVSANHRFYRLANYQMGELKPSNQFHDLFHADYAAIKQDIQSVWAGEKLSDASVYCVTVITRAGTLMELKVAAEYSPDLGHVILGVLALADDEQSEGALQILNMTGTKPPGKITQAIKKRIAGQDTQGLARSVASNLIHKDLQLDNMMQKLERIIQVSEKIQKVEQTASTQQGPQTLSGNLAEFSIIDLCQILIQGTKTGHLRINDEGDQYFASLYVYCGSFVHAATAKGDTGEMALVKIIKYGKGKFDFFFNERTVEASLKGDSMAVLMDACRQADEQSA